MKSPSWILNKDTENKSSTGLHMSQELIVSEELPTFNEIMFFAKTQVKWDVKLSDSQS